ncbi:MAG TPA: TPM domain-containing protein [Telluria sp.]
MQRLQRQWRHWTTTSGHGRALFTEQALAALAQAITSGEQRHRGEVRLIVEHALPSEAIWADVTMRQRALALFAEYGVWDTEDNCGVLLYVNLAEHKVEIVTDRHIARKIDPSTWQQVCRTMTDGFAKGAFGASTLAAIEQVNGLLTTHFPASGARSNELPDRPIML